MPARNFWPTSVRRLAVRLAEIVVSRYGSGFPPGHYYSPIPSEADIRRGVPHLMDPPAQLPGIDFNTDRQLELLKAFKPLHADQPFPVTQTEGIRYYFDNDFFGYGDGLALHCLMRHLEPKQIIEVGSGFSSALMLDTNQRFLDGRVAITFIEPYPERLRSLLLAGDEEGATLLTVPLQEVDPGLFGALEAGDILFIDSSHVSKVGSDVNWLLFEVLPHLAPGVFVHFHDIFYPFEYPTEWLERGHVWNEAYLLHAFLMFNDCFDIAFFNSYLAIHHHDSLVRNLPMASNNPGASIWLERKG